MQGAAAIKRLNHLVGELEGAYHEASYLLGMSDSVSLVLYTLCTHGRSCPLHEICGQTGLSKQTVNSAVRKLEGEGLVYLESMDGKAKRVCLTMAGESYAAGTAQEIIRMENEILDGWPPEDVERYVAPTERFLEGMRTEVAALRARKGARRPPADGGSGL